MYEGIIAEVFRCSIAFAVVVTSRSSSFEYTMSVHAGAERNVCNIVVSTETPQTTTCPSQTLLSVYKLAHLHLPPLQVLTSNNPTTFSSAFLPRCAIDEYKVLCTGPNILEMYIIYLHVYTCQYMRLFHLSHVPRVRLACAFLKFHQHFYVLTDIYM